MPPLSSDVVLMGSDIEMNSSDQTKVDTSINAKVPQTRTINGKPLSADISLTAADVGARSSSWMPTLADLHGVPTSRRINGKALNQDITITAEDVGLVFTDPNSDGNLVFGGS